jgi:hypothetical protein
MTPKQTRFVAEYLANGLNATNAAIFESSLQNGHESSFRLGELNLSGYGLVTRRCCFSHLSCLSRGREFDAAWVHS